jgi:hypothetical protein
MHSRTVCPEPGVRNPNEVCSSQPSCRSWDVGFGNIKNARGHLDSCSRVRGARRGIRTPTVTRWILSPVRLPVPPFSHDGCILLMQLHFLTGHRVKCQGKRGERAGPLRCKSTGHFGRIVGRTPWRTLSKGGYPTAMSVSTSNVEHLSALPDPRILLKMGHTLIDIIKHGSMPRHCGR